MKPKLPELSPCCGAHTTYHEDVLCCKACWNEVDPLSLKHTHSPIEDEREYSPDDDGDALMGSDG